MASTKRTPAQRRIIEAIKSMPYQPLRGELDALEAAYDGGGAFDDELAAWLEAELLLTHEVQRDERANERELSQMRSEVESVGRFFRRALSAGVPT